MTLCLVLIHPYTGQAQQSEGGAQSAKPSYTYRFLNFSFISNLEIESQGGWEDDALPPLTYVAPSTFHFLLANHACHLLPLKPPTTFE